MRIGIDFDNTIVSYDALFHRVARERGLVPDGLPAKKLAVRDHLRSSGMEDLWTEMQGYVYGARMDEADAFPGVLDFLRWTRDRAVAVSIISHKTRYPFLGPRYDLHAAARRWIDARLVDAGLVDVSEIFFELTKEQKVSRIVASACDYYIDDLPEILLADGFPRGTSGILFDPDGHYGKSHSAVRVNNWHGMLRYFERECCPAR